MKIFSYPVFNLRLLCLAGFLSCMPTASHAETIYVDASVDRVAFQDGKSWENAFYSLQDALAVSRKGDEIWLAAGMYYPDEGVGQEDNDRQATFLLEEGVAIYGGFAGFEEALEQRDVHANKTVLSGNLEQKFESTDPGIRATRIVQAHHVTGRSRLDGVTVASGKVPGPPFLNGPSWLGSGLALFDASPTLHDCTFEDNYDRGRGAAMYCFRGSPVITNCRFSENAILPSGGQSIRMRPWGPYWWTGGAAIFMIESSPRISDSTFENQYAIENGGALFLNQSAPIIARCLFHGNRGFEEGGALRSYMSRSVIIESTFMKNRLNALEYTIGGAVVSSSSDRFILCRFVDNGGGWWGGPVAVPRGGYSLELSSVRSRRDLDDATSTSHVILASVNGSLHILITNSQEDIVLDKPERLLVEGPSLLDLEKLMLQDPLPQLSQEEQGDVLMKIAEVTRYPAIVPTRFENCSFDYIWTDDPIIWPYWETVSTGPQLCDPNPGPCQIKHVEPFVFPVTADTQESFLDLSEVFNEEAVAFELESVEPEGRFGVNLIGGELSLTGISQASLGTTIVTVAAFDGTAWATLPVTIHIRADRLYVQAGAPVGGDGLSWENAFSSLQDSLTLARLGAMTQIWVSEGIYYPDEGTSMTNNDPSASFELVSGVEILGGFPKGATSISERNPLEFLSVLSGDIDQNDVDEDGNGIAETPDAIAGVNAYHVLKVLSTDRSAVLDGFTITAGHASGKDEAIEVREGGGLYMRFGKATFRRCHFIGNSSEADGGGVFAFDSCPAFYECTLSSNRAGDDGGAIYTWLGRPVLDRCRLAGNEAGDRGGAIYNVDASLELVTGLISGNRAANEGGGVYWRGVGRDSQPRLMNVTATGNAAGTSGGAFFIEIGDGALLPTLENILAWNNAANGSVDTVSASLASDPAGLPTGVRMYANNNLIQNISPSVLETLAPERWGVSNSGNLDGTDSAVNVAFVAPEEPASAPTIAGNYRLRKKSSAVDAGTNRNMIVPKDLLGRRRFVDGDRDGEVAIDLGAFEVGWETFAKVYPDLDPHADDNGNGRSNYFDYSIGTDPRTWTDEVSLLIEADATDSFVASFLKRREAADVDVTLEWSANLVDWQPIDPESHPALRVLEIRTLTPTQERVRVRVQGLGAPQRTVYVRQRVAGLL